MTEFAKLYETERGQVLVMRDTDDDCKPALKFFFYVGSESIGMAGFVMSFSDDDKGNAAADTAFRNVDEALATSIAFQEIDKINNLFGDAV